MQWFNSMFASTSCLHPMTVNNLIIKVQSHCLENFLSLACWLLRSEDRIPYHQSQWYSHHTFVFIPTYPVSVRNEAPDGCMTSRCTSPYIYVLPVISQHHTRLHYQSMKDTLFTEKSTLLDWMLGQQLPQHWTIFRRVWKKNAEALCNRRYTCIYRYIAYCWLSILVCRESCCYGHLPHTLYTYTTALKLMLLPQNRTQKETL